MDVTENADNYVDAPIPDDYFDEIFRTGFTGNEPVDPDTPGLSQLGKAAVEYARKGLLVFPKRAGGKAPILKGGAKIATNDEGQVARWWTDYPHANIGIATGIPNETGALVRDPFYIDVVDFDKKITTDGVRLKNGDLALDLWVGANLHVGAIGKATTRHGGTHLYYPARNSKSGALKLYAVDYLSNGTSVTAPPSIIRADLGVDGPGVYEWVDPLTLDRPGIPCFWAWFYKNIEGQPFNPPLPPKPRISRGSGSEGALVKKLAATMREESEGGRNRSLYSKAYYLFEQYPDAAPDELIIAAMEAGLSEEEATRTVASAAESTNASWSSDLG